MLWQNPSNIRSFEAGPYDNCYNLNNQTNMHGNVIHASSSGSHNWTTAWTKVDVSEDQLRLYFEKAGIFPTEPPSLRRCYSSSSSLSTLDSCESSCSSLPSSTVLGRVPTVVLTSPRIIFGGFWEKTRLEGEKSRTSLHKLDHTDSDQEKTDPPKLVHTNSSDSISSAGSKASNTLSLCSSTRTYPHPAIRSRKHAHQEKEKILVVSFDPEVQVIEFQNDEAIHRIRGNRWIFWFD